MLARLYRRVLRLVLQVWHHGEQSRPRCRLGYMLPLVMEPLKEVSVAVARPDDPLRRWPVGMVLEIGVYLIVMALSALAALAAWLIF